MTMYFSKFAPHVSGRMHRIYIKWLNNESGSSLVENLVAIGVVGVGLAGFAALSGNISVLGDKSSQKSVAITMAQDKIETIKNLSTKIELPDSDSLTSPVVSSGSWSSTLGETIDSEGEVSTSEAEEDIGDHFHRSWTITPSPDLHNFFDLSVEVSWIDRSSINQTVTLATQISQDSRVASATIDDSVDIDTEADEPAVFPGPATVDPATIVVAGQRTCPAGAQGFEDGFGNWCCPNMGGNMQMGGQMAGGQMAGGQMGPGPGSMGPGGQMGQMMGGQMACGD